VVGSILGMINGGATHVGVATDHVIESFRNRLWPGYKTGAGIDPDLFGQFQLLEDALVALGVPTWPMVEFEADDALAAAAAIAAAAAAERRPMRIVGSICCCRSPMLPSGLDNVKSNFRPRNAECTASGIPHCGTIPLPL
jgi:hypothetical protein